MLFRSCGIKSSSRTSVSCPSSFKDLVKENIKRSFTINEAIVFNTNSGLFYGMQKETSIPIYVRFGSIKSQNFRRFLDKVSIINGMKEKLTHLEPYIYHGINSNYYYSVMKNSGYKRLTEAIMINEFDITKFNLWFGMKGLIETLNQLHINNVCHGHISPNTILVFNNVGTNREISTGGLLFI